MKQAALMHHVVTAVFLWCAPRCVRVTDARACGRARFGVFPFEAWTLYEFVQRRPDIHANFAPALYLLRFAAQPRATG